MNFVILMMANTCHVTDEDAYTYSVPVCFRKTVTASIGSSAAFLESGLEGFEPNRKVKF